jgi:hypothetical protein
MNLETGLSLYVCDADYTSLYPSIMRAINSSRMTLRFVPFAIEGKTADDVQRYFSNLIHVRENAEALASSFFNLPGYGEMKKLVDEHFTTIPQ